MRLARFLVPGEEMPRVGDVRGAEVLSSQPGTTVGEVLAGTRDFDHTGEVFSLGDVRLLMPYQPRAIFLVGINYSAHREAAEARDLLPVLNPGEIPCLLKGPASPIGPYDDIIKPAGIECLDYEGELLVVIGRDGTAGGFAVANDVSARDVGDRWQLTRHKGGDTFCPWGPWVTTSDEVDDPYDLRVRTWVDDDLCQDGNTSEMLADIPEIIEYVGKTIALRPGDAILTGTPAGTIAEKDQPNWLRPGQLVKVEIDGLGSIANRVASG